METTQESITTFEEQDLAYIESFCEYLDKTGDTIERGFAEQLQDSGERIQEYER